MRDFILAVLLVSFSIGGAATAAENEIFEIKAEGLYQMEAGTSVDLAKKVALFNAKRKAVDLAGRYLARKGLIEAYEVNRDEIYSLTARAVQAEILEQKLEAAEKASTYRIRIRARIQASDFIKAEMEDKQQEKKEKKRVFL